LKFPQVPGNTPFSPIFCIQFATDLQQAMSAHLDELRKQYPGQMVLTPEQAAKALGNLKKKTVYNQVSKKTFPVRVIKSGKSGWGADIIDMARYLATGIPYDPTKEPEADKPKKRGRPPKPLLILHQEFWAEVVVLLHLQEAEAEKAELLQAIADIELPHREPPILGGKI
jgi:predicted DNA-binding transcriptional regulator AlpA